MTNDLNENESQKLNRFIGEGNYWNALNFLKNIDHEKNFNDRLVFWTCLF